MQVIRAEKKEKKKKEILGTNIYIYLDTHIYPYISKKHICSLEPQQGKIMTINMKVMQQKKPLVKEEKYHLVLSFIIKFSWKKHCDWLSLNIHEM